MGLRSGIHARSTNSFGFQNVRKCAYVHAQQMHETYTDLQQTGQRGKGADVLILADKVGPALDVRTPATRTHTEDI